MELGKPVVSLSLPCVVLYAEFLDQYRYPEFHRVFRIWRNLLMLKRAGRGQDPAGAKATTQGELAVECPACPHPGRNLPVGWESAGALLYVSTIH
jgi:hypothetical protein